MSCETTPNCDSSVVEIDDSDEDCVILDQSREILKYSEQIILRFHRATSITELDACVQIYFSFMKKRLESFKGDTRKFLLVGFYHQINKIYIIYDYNRDIYTLNGSNFYWYMEDLLVLYCNLEFSFYGDILMSNPTATAIPAVHRIYGMLYHTLDKRTKHIMNVLLRIDKRYFCMDFSRIINALFKRVAITEYLFHSHIVKPDGFCRLSLIIELWKHIRRPEEWPIMEFTVYILTKWEKTTLKKHDELMHILKEKVEENSLNEINTVQKCIQRYFDTYCVRVAESLEITDKNHRPNINGRYISERTKSVTLEPNNRAPSNEFLPSSDTSRSIAGDKQKVSPAETPLSADVPQTCSREIAQPQSNLNTNDCSLPLGYNKSNLITQSACSQPQSTPTTGTDQQLSANANLNAVNVTQIDFQGVDDQTLDLSANSCYNIKLENSNDLSTIESIVDESIKFVTNHAKDVNPFDATPKSEALNSYEYMWDFIFKTAECTLEGNEQSCNDQENFGERNGQSISSVSSTSVENVNTSSWNSEMCNENNRSGQTPMVSPDSSNTANLQNDRESMDKCHLPFKKRKRATIPNQVDNSCTSYREHTLGYRLIPISPPNPNSDASFPSNVFDHKDNPVDNRPIYGVFEFMAMPAFYTNPILMIKECEGLVCPSFLSTCTNVKNTVDNSTQINVPSTANHSQLSSEDLPIDIEHQTSTSVASTPQQGRCNISIRDISTISESSIAQPQLSDHNETHSTLDVSLNTNETSSNGSTQPPHGDHALHHRPTSINVLNTMNTLSQSDNLPADLASTSPSNDEHVLNLSTRPNDLPVEERLLPNATTKSYNNPITHYQNALAVSNDYTIEISPHSPHHATDVHAFSPTNEVRNLNLQIPANYRHSVDLSGSVNPDENSSSEHRPNTLPHARNVHTYNTFSMIADKANGQQINILPSHSTTLGLSNFVSANDNTNIPTTPLAYNIAPVHTLPHTKHFIPNNKEFIPQINSNVHHNYPTLANRRSGQNSTYEHQQLESEYLHGQHQNRSGTQSHERTFQKKNTTKAYASSGRTNILGPTATKSLPPVQSDTMLYNKSVDQQNMISSSQTATGIESSHVLQYQNPGRPSQSRIPKRTHTVTSSQQLFEQNQPYTRMLPPLQPNGIPPHDAATHHHNAISQQHNVMLQQQHVIPHHYPTSRQWEPDATSQHHNALLQQQQHNVISRNYQTPQQLYATMLQQQNGLLQQPRHDAIMPQTSQHEPILQQQQHCIIPQPQQHNAISQYPLLEAMPRKSRNRTITQQSQQNAMPQQYIVLPQLPQHEVMSPKASRCAIPQQQKQNALSRPRQHNGNPRQQQPSTLPQQLQNCETSLSTNEQESNQATASRMEMPILIPEEPIIGKRGRPKKKQKKTK